MAVIGTVPQENISDDKGAALSTWRLWFTQAYTILFANQQSGTTANRPTDPKTFWIGRRYYDTTLNKPVFISAVSAGVATWRDAAANVV